MMVSENEERHKTAYCVTCDYRHGALGYLGSLHGAQLTLESLQVQRPGSQLLTEL